MRAAIYARYSSDLQDARSLADQIMLCRERAVREDWTVVGEYVDAALSGSVSHNRPGLMDLVGAARKHRFEILVTESIDRLSGDQEDIAGLHKRLSYWGIKIVTLADGEVGKIHIGLKGLMASLFLDDLAQKVKRGHIGAVRGGRIACGHAYGYDLVKGEPGVRLINEPQAAIVRRLFEEYLAGNSAITIVTGLKRDGIPSPEGRLWNKATLVGARTRSSGLLSNRLYIGEIVYGTQRYVRDPETGRKRGRRGAASDLVITHAPDLAIVDRPVFDAVQQRREERRGVPPSAARRPKHLLSGLLVCGSCGSNFIVKRGARFGCNRLLASGACTNRRTILTHDVEARVLATLTSRLLQPEAMTAAVEAYHAERTRLAALRVREGRNAARELAAIEGRISRLVATIEAGGDPRALAARLNELEAERRAMLARTPENKATVVPPYPAAASAYRAKVETIQAALRGGFDASREALALVRQLITRVVITPTSPRTPMGLDIEGDLAALLAQDSARSAIAGASSP